MSRPNDSSTEQLRRIPGLFRKWELPDVFEAQRNYQIEEAGEHADGTPLFALFVSCQTCGTEETSIDSHPPFENASERPQVSHRSRGIHLSVLVGEPESSS